MYNEMGDMDSVTKRAIERRQRLIDAMQRKEPISHNKLHMLLKNNITCAFEISYRVYSGFNWCVITLSKNGKSTRDAMPLDDTDRAFVSEHVVGKYSSLLNGQIWYLTF